MDGTVRPLGNRLYVERVKRERTEGGIIIPETFDTKFSARLKHAAVPDYFLARVLAKGEEVREDIDVGALTYVWTYAEGDGSKLWTGDDSGEKGRMFITERDLVGVEVVE
jgi:co-chaperonin GroES (HSP10)